MSIGTKAHSATVNRIAYRYEGEVDFGDGPDIRTPNMVIEVETSATIRDGLKRLSKYDGPVYLAVTNREALREALPLVKGRSVGLMNPQGDIIYPYPES